MASSVTIARDGSNPPGRITRFPRRPNIQWAGIRRNDKPSPRRGTGEWARAEYCMVQDPSRPSVRALVSAELLAFSRQVTLGTTARGCNSRPPRRPLSRSLLTRTSTATVITTATLTRNHQHGAPRFIAGGAPFVRLVRQEASSADSSIVADWPTRPREPMSSSERSRAEPGSTRSPLDRIAARRRLSAPAGCAGACFRGI